MEVFLSNLNLPQASAQQKELLNKPLLLDEVSAAIDKLQSNKAPGPDGFSSEFYRKLKNTLINPLYKMLVHSFDQCTLPNTMMEANISLILKKDKPADKCSSYHPISLLNVDRKLLAKILARRL